MARSPREHRRRKRTKPTCQVHGKGENQMKKFAIGCFGVLVVLAVVGGGIAWFKVIKPGMEFAGGIAELGQQYSALNDSIENRSGFTPPDDGALSQARFDRFLVAQRAMR